MPSSRATIAQAATDLLTAASGGGFFGVTFTATRKAVPANLLEDLTDLTLTVCPIGPEARKLVTRGLVQKVFSIDIGIQQRLTTDCNPETPGGNTEIDALMAFAELVALFFQPDGPNKGLIPETTAMWCEEGPNAIDPPYDVAHLREKRTFTSRLILTVRYY